MRISPVVENKIKKEFMALCSSKYSFSDENAPQGQNNYSTNFILNDRSEGKYLLKVLLLNKIPTVNLDQARSEIEICKRLKSPYVVPLVDFEETNDYVFLVFPYIDGKNLEEYASMHKELTEQEITEIGIGILRGIADIHRSSNGSIVHQDLKPENILIDKNGNTLILDFGAARYKKSPFRGNARHNYAYSSREQIRGSRPNTLQELRITLCDKADVFSTGLILYRLIDGKHPHADLGDVKPADAIFDALPIPQIKNQKVSDGLKRIVYRMLEYEPLNRLNSADAIKALESGEVQLISLDNNGFYYCGASSIARCIKFKDANQSLFDGLVVEISQLPSERSKIAEMHTNIKTLIVDPQTYLFQKPDLMSKKYKSLLEYSQYEEIFKDPKELLKMILNKDTRVINFIKKVFELEISTGSDVLVAPYFYISEFNDDYWTIDQEISKLSYEVYSNLEAIKPLIKGITISEEILQSDESRNRILEYLQSLYEYSGFVVLLDSPHKETIVNENWLKCAKNFFTHLLATQKFVIWSRADMFGLTLGTMGLNIAIGEFLKQRKFNINEPPQQFGRRGKYYYSPAMFARIKWPEGVMALNNYEKYDDFVCASECCEKIDFTKLSKRDEDDLAFHMMIKMKIQFDNYKGKNGFDVLKNDLKTAREHYERIRNNSHIIVRKSLDHDVKPMSSSFLQSWANVLGI